MASTDATPIPVINTAFRVTFPILDNTGALVSGAASLAAKISKDAGTFASSSNTPTEIATSSGMYYLDLTSTEMNAQTVAIVVTTTTTNANATPLVIYTYVSGTTAILDSNVKKFGGTTVTGRDIGASVLLSSGTGTGQIVLSSGVAQANTVQFLGTTSLGNPGSVSVDWLQTVNPNGLVDLPNTTFGGLDSAVKIQSGTGTGQLSITSGVVKANLVQILATALTETAGQIAAAFKQFFNITTPTSTMNEITLVDTTTTLANAPAFNGPSAATIAAATRDVNNTSPAANSLGAAVNAASAPTVEEIDDELSANHGSGAWGSSSGSGAFTVTVTVSDGSSPVPNANVRVSSGITSYVATTNGSGVASFALDAATWGLAITKSGYSFTPTTIAVTASANFNETITPVVIPNPPSGSPYCNVFGYFEGLSTSTARGVPITFTLSHTPAKSGAIIITDPIVATIVNGQILGPRGAPFIALVRNDSITPSDTTYSVTCQAIGFSNVEMTLAADTFDLSTLIS